MTPIERAARAMYDEIGPEWDWNDPDAELLRVMYRANARVAFASLRTASDEMRKAGLEYADNAENLTVDGLWTVMMDAAITE